MSISATQPSQLTTAERDEFIAFVLKAGEVGAATLSNLVDQAVTLVTLRDGQTLIGTAGIKRPNEGYRRKQFVKAKVEGLIDAYPLELGWVHVHSDHRDKQHSSELVKKALEAVPGRALYATTKSPKMERTLIRHGFAVQGDPYPSKENSTAKLTLFVRPA